MIEQPSEFLATLDLTVLEDRIYPDEVDLVERYLAEVIQLFFARSGAAGDTKE